MTNYPCTSCGVCCTKVKTAVETLNFDFPFGWDKSGCCEKLIDNKCSVYEDRPLICNIDRLWELTNLTKEEFYELNIKACNKMMHESNIPIEFRIREL